MSRFRVSGVSVVLCILVDASEPAPGDLLGGGTVMACARLVIYPFDKSEAGCLVSIAMEYAQQVLAGERHIEPPARVDDRGLQLYAEGKTKAGDLHVELEESLGSFFSAVQPESFLRFLVFFHTTP